MHGFHNIALFAAAANALAILILLIGRPRGSAPRAIMLFCLGVALWNVGVWGLFSSDHESAARAWARLAWAGLLLTPSTFLHLAVLTTGATRWRWRVVAGYALSLCCIGLLATPWGIDRLDFSFGAWFAAPTPVILFYVAVFMPTGLTLSGWLLSHHFRSTDPLVRSRSRTLIIIVALMPIAGLNECLHLTGLRPPPTTAVDAMPWSSLAASCYGILAAASFLNDRLVRLRLFIGHRLALGLRLLFFTLVMLLLLLVGELLLPGSTPSTGRLTTVGAGLVAALLCVVPFPLHLDTAISRWRRRLLGENLAFHEKLQSFIERIPFIDDDSRLLEETCDVLVHAWDLPGCAVMIRDRTDHLWARGVRPDGECPISPEAVTWAGNTLQLKLAVRREDLEPARTPALTATDFQHVFPLGEKDGEARGFLALGPRPSGPWTDTDSQQVRSLCQHLVFQFERLAFVQTEKLRQINAAKDRFLSSINHEMRNPLNGVKGISEMLQAEVRSPRGDYLLRSLRACVDRLGATIEDVMDFANLDAGAIILNETRFELAPFLADTCHPYNLQRTQVTGLPPAGPPLWLWGDTGKLRQILCNYLDNALKYGEGGTVTLQVQPEAAAEDGVHLLFTVTNEGGTLRDTNIENLFAPFERGQRADETQAPGLGIGLSICRRVGAAMGGRTSARSIDGRTEFSFACTFRPAASEEAEPPTSWPVDSRSLRVLSIEDEDYNRLALAHYLESLDIAATWAADGETALTSLAEDDAFDLILMDWNLPGLAGERLLTAIQTHYGLTAPPVVVVSAYSTVAKRDACLRAGAAAFVSKPLTADSLREGLARALNHPRDNRTAKLNALPTAQWSPTPIQQAELRQSALTDVKEMLTLWDDAPRRAVHLAHTAKGKLLLIGESNLSAQLELVENHPDPSARELLPVRTLIAEMLTTLETNPPRNPSQGGPNPVQSKPD